MAQAVDIHMWTRAVFSEDAIRRFEDRFGVSIPAAMKQSGVSAQSQSRENKELFALSVAALDNMLDRLFPDEQDRCAFIEGRGPPIPSPSMTLFVVNDALWSIMRRKSSYPDRMLPMVTSPWFHWDEKMEEQGNRAGIVREPIGNVNLSINETGQLIVSGHGGDFCGLVEARLIHPKARSIILPASPGRRDLVPNYRLTQLSVTIEPRIHQLTLYPEPDKRFDYRYSESPKMYYEHGLNITTDGSRVLLSTSGDKARPLRGEVTILLGMMPDMHETETLILEHLWLRALAKSLSDTQDENGQSTERIIKT